MIGNNQNSRVCWKLLDYLSGHGIQSFVHLTHCISKTSFGFWVMKKMTAVHVLPEIVLHSVNRHEDKHHHVLRMVFQKVKSDRGPLPVDFLHFGEHLSAPPVGGHESQEPDIVINLAEMIDQFAFK